MKNDAFKYTSPVKKQGHEAPMDICDFAFLKELVGKVSHFQSEVHQTSKDHGWHDTPLHDAVYLSLIHAEVSEAVEVLRESPIQINEALRNERLGGELADIILRTLDFAALKGIDLGLKVAEKHLKNQKRTFKHGGKRF